MVADFAFCLATAIQNNKVGPLRRLRFTALEFSTPIGVNYSRDGPPILGLGLLYDGCQSKVGISAQLAKATNTTYEVQ